MHGHGARPFGALRSSLNHVCRLAGARRQHLAQRIESRVKLFIGERRQPAEVLNLHFLRHEQGANRHVLCRLVFRHPFNGLRPFPAEVVGERFEERLKM